jgi:hypothetical protein
MARRTTVAFWTVCCMAVAVSGPCWPATLTQDAVHVIYDSADEALARQAARIIQDALHELGPRLPAGDDPIIVAVCHTVAEFERYAGPYARPNVTGIAMPSQGVIAVKAPRLVPQGPDFTGTLRHELIHVLLARNVPAGRLPRWLEEGIAMTFSREYRWGSKLRIGQMYAQGQIIPYRELEWAFLEPGRETEFGDAYAQALSMTRFLREELSEDEFWALVHDLDTMTFPAALKRHADISVTGLVDAWRRSLWKVAVVFSIVSGFSIFQLMALLTVYAYLRKRRQGRRILRRWEDEEGDVPTLTVLDLEDNEPLYPWEEEEDETYL